MGDNSAVAKRVAVLERPAPAVEPSRPQPPAPGSAVPENGSPAHTAPRELLIVLEELAASVRAGRYVTNDRDGVLVDTVVGNTRCLLLVHEPTTTVRLSPREQEIARMVANGRTNSAIAAALEISVWTVSTHLRRIFAKLAVGSRAEMVAHLLGERQMPAVTGYEHDR